MIRPARGISKTAGQLSALAGLRCGRAALCPAVCTDQGLGFGDPEGCRWVGATGLQLAKRMARTARQLPALSQGRGMGQAGLCLAAVLILRQLLEIKHSL